MEATTHTVLSQGEALGWSHGVIALSVAAHLALALIAILVPVLLMRVARRRPELPFGRLSNSLLAFGMVAALASLADVWNIWHTDYWLEAALLALTALTGAAVVGSVVRALPQWLALPSAADLQAARHSAGQAARELEAFTASVSHDLRSPLSSIAGQAGLLEIALGEQANDDQKRRLNRIQISVKQMSELIESLLMLSRIARTPMQMERVDLSAMAQNIADELRGQDPQRQVEIRIAPNMVVKGDRKLLTTCLGNLMSNAWRFTSRSAAASIEVGVVPGAAEITVHVRDNGLGFDMSHAEKLFKPFAKLHGNELSGSGMGLAMVQRIVERHGGRAWAEGKVNEGCVVYCSLPIDLPSRAPQEVAESA